MSAHNPLSYREEQILEWWDAGDSVELIAERLNLPYSRIHQILRQALVVVRREADIPRLVKELGELLGKDVSG